VIDLAQGDRLAVDEQAPVAHLHGLAAAGDHAVDAGQALGDGMHHHVTDPRRDRSAVRLGTVGEDHRPFGQRRLHGR
jgi:hypothetical protein